MDCYVGLDVSLRSVRICVIDVEGKHIFERSVACEIEDILACLRDVPAGQYRVSFESGAMWADNTEFRHEKLEGTV